MLKFIENKFLELSFKIKIELYLLVILISYFLIYNIELSFEKRDFHPPLLKNNISSKTFQNINLSLLKKIETYASKKKIKILQIKTSKNAVFISGKANIKQISEFILFLETLNNYSNVKYLLINKIKKTIYSFEVNIAFQNQYIKNKKLFLKKTNKKKQEKYKLKAVIADYALINDKWYKLNNYIGGYQIISIEKDFIEIKNEKKVLKVKMRKNEKY